jgi:periplasmic divalent cation tolerance protein
MDTAKPSPRCVAVLVTSPPDRAPEIARAIVEERLAACASILPAVRSIYSWQGKLCDDGEALLVIKTRPERFERLRARIVELHPYEVPEIVALPIVAGHEPYLAWVEGSTRE